MIRGLKFVSIPVRNQDASLRFFTEKLGFKVGTDQPFSDQQRWIELLIPGAETGLVLSLIHISICFISVSSVSTSSCLAPCNPF